MEPVAPITSHIHSVAPQSLSMFDLFLSADPLVKFVMIILIFASIWSWTIIIFKFMRLQNVNRSAAEFEDAFWSGGALDDLYERINRQATDPMSVLFCTAMRELRRSSLSTVHGLTIHNRLDRLMQTTINREMAGLEKHMTFLATLGANGMIVGLFGTVIGIMNSFENIAAQQNTNLAVVAPGIAEALFATAIGLVAALPAAIAYNKLSSDLNKFANRMDGFANDFVAIVSRQIEDPRVG